MKLLLISVHPVLEYDEIALFESLGHEVFALGFYFHRAEAATLRPNLKETSWHEEMRDLFVNSGCRSHVPTDGYHITSTFVRAFDAVIVHHNFRFIEANMEILRGTRVVWRGIGQEPQAVEAVIPTMRKNGVKIVRWSPAESRLPDYAGADAVIRATKSPTDWHSWVGDEPSVLSFANNFAERREALSYDFYYESVATLPYVMYGLSNEGCPGWQGLLDYEQQRQAIRGHRAFFCTGTIPASYTLGFIEAWMSGAPVVHIGNSRHRHLGFEIFEVHEHISNAVDGFVVDTPGEARDTLRQLLENPQLARDTSERGRLAAIGLFGWDTGRTAWEAFLQTM